MQETKNHEASQNLLTGLKFKYPHDTIIVELDTSGSTKNWYVVSKTGVIDSKPGSGLCLHHVGTHDLVNDQAAEMAKAIKNTYDDQMFIIKLKNQLTAVGLIAAAALVAFVVSVIV